MRQNPASPLNDAGASETETKPAPFELPAADAHKAAPAEGTIVPPTLTTSQDAAVDGAAPAIAANHDSAEIARVLHDVTQAAIDNRPGHLELDVKLNGGDRLHVSIDWAQGQLRMTFRSPSPDLRTALEQAWPTFRQEATANGLPVAEVRFEGSSLGGQQSFSEHSSHGDRHADQASATGEQPFSQRQQSRERRESPARQQTYTEEPLWA
jgi:hypothetical protein